jgi:hypothetical protein
MRKSDPNPDLSKRLKAYLQKQDSPVSAKWLSLQLSFELKKTNQILCRLVKGGEVKSQVRAEFDFEFSPKQSRTIACYRRRKYYWLCA